MSVPSKDPLTRIQIDMNNRSTLCMSHQFGLPWNSPQTSPAAISRSLNITSPHGHRPTQIALPISHRQYCDRIMDELCFRKRVANVSSRISQILKLEQTKNLLEYRRTAYLDSLQITTTKYSHVLPSLAGDYLDEIRQNAMEDFRRNGKEVSIVDCQINRNDQFHQKEDLGINAGFDVKMPREVKKRKSSDCEDGSDYSFTLTSLSNHETDDSNASPDKFFIPKHCKRHSFRYAKCRRQASSSKKSELVNKVEDVSQYLASLDSKRLRLAGQYHTKYCHMSFDNYVEKSRY